MSMETLRRRWTMWLLALALSLTVVLSGVAGPAHAAFEGEDGGPVASEGVDIEPDDRGGAESEETAVPRDSDPTFGNGRCKRCGWWWLW